MVNKTTFTYPSRDGIHTIQGYKWQSDVTPRGIFQIVHGMQEHMSRYDEFAEFLCNNGFIVVGNDHLGHGPISDDLGYFTKDNADVVVVRDVHRLKKMTQNEHPGLPYFILGHSMGSFIFRKYLTMYGKGINGAIICGSGFMPAIATGAGKFLASFFGLFGKGHNYSKLITKIAFGSYNKRISDVKYGNEWVVRNDEVLKKYNDDPLCGFPFTTNGYHTLFSIFHFVNKKKNLTTIPTDLPIFIIAGKEDPVGAYGKGPEKIYDMFKELDFSNLSIKLYDDMRHEILNDVDRNIVHNDVLNWLNSIVVE